ncbi:MAG: hypothetical protein Q9220_004273 [cf. Caloplaca sp. 1 TL-2023]
MADNVDYNDLKRLIKIRTTRGQGEALTIPGLENEAKALRSFEHELFRELSDQHQRVDLFVQSKAGEINRRLSHLDRQIGQLQQRYILHQSGRVSVKRLEKFSRAEEAAEKAGEEIQSLARFVGAQKLAFRKILKKYKKWTASSTLESRFRTKILEQPGAFSKRDFQPLLSQYNDVLAAVRAPFERDQAGRTDQIKPTTDRPAIANGVTLKSGKQPNLPSLQRSRTGGKKAKNVALEIQAISMDRSAVELDTALAVLPIGVSGGKASYWVHPDNLVELHVLILQYTRLRRTTSSQVTTPVVNGTQLQSRRVSTNGNQHGLADTDNDQMGFIVCDDLESFARRRSSAPINDAEGSAGRVLEESATTISYLPTAEAVVAVDTSFDASLKKKTSATFQTVNMKKKAVRKLFQLAQREVPAEASALDQESDDGEDVNSIRSWLDSHREVQPLVQLQSKRSRFTGLNNGEAGGMWCFLDRDILMRKTPQGFFASKEGNLAFDASEDGVFAQFPFAVLEVRFEGGFGTSFLKALDESHLVGRNRVQDVVGGFSANLSTDRKNQGLLDGDACCRDSLRAARHATALPALDQDLRKLPSTIKTNISRQSSVQLSSGQSSADKNSTSATSATMHAGSGFSIPIGESPATSAPEILAPSPQKSLRKKRRHGKDRSLRQQMVMNKQPNHQRYWNEYDDGDEDSDNEPFAIYVDPNKSTSFPGFHTISKAALSLASRAKASSKKARSWIRYSDDPQNLLHPVATPEDDSDLEDSPIDPLLHHRKQRQYSTFHNRYIPDDTHRARELLLTRCCTASFVASFVLLIVAGLLASSGRRKAHLEVDAGIVTGVVFSLVFSLAGVGCMLQRNEKAGMIQKVSVFTMMVIVCIGSGLLLGGIFDG